MGGNIVADVGVKIGNPADSPLVSDILRETENLARRTGASTDAVTATALGQKGDLVTALEIGVASSAAYDFLKAVVMRFVGRRDYDPKIEIVVNDITVQLGELSQDTGSTR
jgi:hypothetical protein